MKEQAKAINVDCNQNEIHTIIQRSLDAWEIDKTIDELDLILSNETFSKADELIAKMEMTLSEKTTCSDESMKECGLRYYLAVMIYFKISDPRASLGFCPFISAYYSTRNKKKK